MALPRFKYADGYSWLNAAAGVGVDLACFEALVRQGDRHRITTDLPAALTAYQRAVRLYRGDLWSGPDLHAVIERERLRASYLSVIARLADQYYAQRQYDACLDCCGRLLTSDPCREDAHRITRRCHVHQEERAQALLELRLGVRVGLHMTRPRFQPAGARGMRISHRRSQLCWL